MDEAATDMDVFDKIEDLKDPDVVYINDLKDSGIEQTILNPFIIEGNLDIAKENVVNNFEVNS